MRPTVLVRSWSVSWWRNERGIVLALALVVMTLLMGVGSAALFSGYTNLQTSTNLRLGTRARATAEAAVNEALYRLSRQEGKPGAIAPDLTTANWQVQILSHGTANSPTQVATIQNVSDWPHAASTPSVVVQYKKDASGNTVRYGFGPSIYGWFFEQLLATSGALYADNGNGRDDRATKVVYNNAAGKAILDWWKAGIDGGYFYNPGQDNAGATTAFQSGKTAMYLESSAALRGNINTAKFQVGTGLFARPDNKPANGGNIIGGASLYIMKSRPADEQQAAWELVKYAMTPMVQAQWQSDTGYYAIRKSAYNEAPAKEWATKYPQFLTAVNQIRESPQNRFTNGAVLGVMPQARARTQKMIESVLLGQATTQAALDAAAAEVNDQIDKYNKANK